MRDRAEFSYNVITSIVDYEVVCPKCGEVNEFEVYIPNAGFMAERMSDNTVSDDQSQCCFNCDYQIDIQSYGEIGNKMVWFENVGIENIKEIKIHEKDLFEEEYDPDMFDIDFKIDADENFWFNMTDMKDLVSSLKNDKNKDVILRLVYVGCFGALEGYLQDKLINLIKENTENLANLLQHDYFGKEKFKLVEIVNMDILKVTIKKINEFVFHRFSTVDSLFEKIIKVDPNSREIMKDFVCRRHHIVHRNNRDSDGEDIILRVTDVEKLIEACENVQGVILKEINNYNNRNMEKAF